MDQYTALASVYDALNFGCDYEGYSRFIDSLIKKYETQKTSLVLDLGCGTGKMTFLLRELGYDMTGVDLSEDMLALAREEADRRGVSDILWLCQNMNGFELYGTVDACVSTLDSINYLTKREDVKKCFSLVHNYLIPDGVFIFDVNTPYRFKSVYGNRDYTLEADGAFLAWQNEYNEKTGLCKFYLSIFKELKDGLYERLDEVQGERCYTKRQIEAWLRDAGFEILSVYGSQAGDAPSECDEKWYFVARCKK